MSAPTCSAAWLRGALVGLCSALVTVAAHTGAGGALPGGGALVLALLVCATVGAAAAGIRVEGRLAGLATLGAVLAAGQLLGHVTLTVAGGHHGGHAVIDGRMLAMHAVATVALGLLIGVVEYLVEVGASVLTWLRLIDIPTCGPTDAAAPAVINDVLPQRVLQLRGLGMRAPPAGVHSCG